MQELLGSNGTRLPRTISEAADAGQVFQERAEGGGPK
jgi:hypothetical protein